MNEKDSQRGIAHAIKYFHAALVRDVLGVNLDLLLIILEFHALAIHQDFLDLHLYGIEYHPLFVGVHEFHFGGATSFSGFLLEIHAQVQAHVVGDESSVRGVMGFGLGVEITRIRGVSVRTSVEEFHFVSGSQVV
jgi:hypothetical protein